jgi:hypothetical protein
MVSYLAEQRNECVRAFEIEPDSPPLHTRVYLGHPLWHEALFRHVDEVRADLEGLGFRVD